MGFVLRDVEDNAEACNVVLVELEISALAAEGVKGSFVISGNDDSSPSISTFRNSMDLTKTTWQFSGLTSR